MLMIFGFIENQPEIKIKTSTATIPKPCCKILSPQNPGASLISKLSGIPYTIKEECKSSTMNIERHLNNSMFDKR